MAGRVSGNAIKAAASLSGTVGAAYETGGMSGVARATVAAPVSSAINSATAPVRDAYREGAAAGYRATSPPSNGTGGAGPSGTGSPPPPSGPPPAPPPAWATNLARRQRFTQAGLAASQALREGDRPGSSSGPNLKDKG